MRHPLPPPARKPAAFSVETVALWEQLLGGPLAGGRLTRILVTHLHLDHVDMAGWLTCRTGCRLPALHDMTGIAAVLDAGRRFRARGPRRRHRFLSPRRLGRSGADTLLLTLRRFRPAAISLPDSYWRIQEGETLRIGDHDREVVVGAGHVPEQACLHDAGRKLLISGDQVLPRISSNVSVHPSEPDADPARRLAFLSPQAMSAYTQRCTGSALAQRAIPRLACATRPAGGRNTQCAGSPYTGTREPQGAIDVFPLLFSAPLRQ